MSARVITQLLDGLLSNTYLNEKLKKPAKLIWITDLITPQHNFCAQLNLFSRSNNHISWNLKIQ
jgi:hypothetical protein